MKMQMENLQSKEEPVYADKKHLGGVQQARRKRGSWSSRTSGEAMALEKTRGRELRQVSHDK